MRIKNPVLRKLWEYGVITFGSAIYALCFNWLFQTNHISMGGFTGVAQIVNRFIPMLPVGVTVIILNVPLFILGVKKTGLHILISSLYAMAVGSLMIDGIAMLYTFPPMEQLLACIYGGVLLGLSMGLLLMVGATTGGTELAARLLKFKLHHLSIGRLCLIIDLMVILLHAITFNNLYNALYGIIAMYISSLVMDAVVYGSINAKMAYIISDNSQAITEQLLKMELGVTQLQGRGAWSGGEKTVVLCAFKRTQIAAIKAAVTAIDPNAFINVIKTNQVSGNFYRKPND